MDLDRPRFCFREELFAGRPARADSVRFAGLWTSGSLAGLARPTVAVVGPRAPSEAARRRALALGEALAHAGACVLSGLALGIDAAAHAGALAGAGATIGILGGGHRQFFPRRNRNLACAIVAGGGAVLSPYAPDEPARPAQFLQRNGVVAALADTVVIVEAAERSGALNTASWAAALGIDVLAYPGDIDQPKAAGCNALIRDGATLVRGASDVLAAMGLVPLTIAEDSPSQNYKTQETLGPLEAEIARSLQDGPRDLDALVEVTHASTGAVIAALVGLEVAGAVERRDAGFYARTR